MNYYGTCLSGLCQLHIYQPILWISGKPLLERTVYEDKDDSRRLSIPIGLRRHGHVPALTLALLFRCNTIIFCSL